MTRPFGGERGRRQVPDHDTGLLTCGNRSRGPGHHGPGGRGGQVDDLRVPRRSEQPGHDPGGAGQRLRRQLDLHGPHLPGVRAGLDAGPVDLGVGQVPDADPGESGAKPPLGMPPGAALRPRGAGRQPQPGGEHGADVRQARQRRARGGVAEPGGSHAGRGQPAPRRAGSQPPGGGVPGLPPPRGDPAQPGGLRAQRDGEQVIGCAVVLGAQDQAVDVPPAQVHRAGIGAARGPGRGDGIAELSGHMLPCIHTSPANRLMSQCARKHTGCDDSGPIAGRAARAVRARKQTVRIPPGRS